jgi:uncharacterized protein YqhQ
VSERDQETIDSETEAGPRVTAPDRRDTPPAISGFDHGDDLGKVHYGGQAVIEGVMMRGPTAVATAVRAANGDIIVHRMPYESASRRNRILRAPVLRGGLTLIESLSLGIKALNYSASVAMEEAARDGAEGGPGAAEAGAAAAGADDRDPWSARLTEERGDGGVAESEPGAGPTAGDGSAAGAGDTVGRGEAPQKRGRASDGRSDWKTNVTLTATLAFAFALGIVIFFWIPMVISGLLTDVLGSDSGILFNVIDGVIRVLFFLVYIWGISRWKEMARVFQYHGAEHRIIFAQEAGVELTPENARRFTTRHPRCGTSFLLIVMVVSILVFMIFGKPPTIGLRLARLLLIPVIAGISYEIMKLAAKHSDRPWARALSAPGVWLQGITTKEPSDDQVEVAIAALKAVRIERNDAREAEVAA